jgi:hypothetical protein
VRCEVSCELHRQEARRRGQRQLTSLSLPLASFFSSLYR